MRNLSLYYNKTYYEYLESEQLESRKINKLIEKENKCLFSTMFIHEKDYRRLDDIENLKKIIMKTKYPGMMIGTGNPHGAGDALGGEGDIQVGFSFDYATGQPYVPGSTVKGVLRSYFKRKDVIKAIIKSAIGKELSDEQISALETNIFENKDVFFDAVLYDGDKNGKILGSEYITPHKSPLKNPTPIHMLKILPGVKFEFRFLVKDFKDVENVNVLISEDEKIKIFQDVLKYFGVGAKTNVGYGILEVCEKDEFQSRTQRDEVEVLRYGKILEIIEAEEQAESEGRNNNPNQRNNNPNQRNNNPNQRGNNSNQRGNNHSSGYRRGGGNFR